MKIVKTNDYSGPDRRPNGNNVTKGWLIGALFSILMLGLGNWVNTIQAEINTVRVTQIGNLQKVASIEEGQKTVVIRLDRIEDKIDRLIENVN